MYTAVITATLRQCRHASKGLDRLGRISIVLKMSLWAGTGSSRAPHLGCAGP